MAYKVASKKTYPSWGYMVEKGATTIWELWNGDTEGPGMNSRNHFALGACGEWYYGYLAGIRANEEIVGFKKFTIAPQTNGDLTWVEGTYQSLYGEIKSRWDKSEDGLKLEITVPANSTASVYVPVLGKENPIIFESGNQLLKDGESSVENPNIKFIEMKNGSAHFEVGSGIYGFEVK